MEKQSSFIKQAAILAAATLFVRFMGFLYRLPLTNLIGDIGIALYQVGFQFYLFILVMSSAGLPNAISKMVSERTAKGQYKNAHLVFKWAFFLALIFGTAGALGLWFFAEFFAVYSGYPGSVYSIRTLAPTILIVALMAVFRGYFQGMGNSAPTAVSQVVEQFFNAIFSVWIAFIFIDNIEHAAAGGAAGTGIGALLGLLVIRWIYFRKAPALHKAISSDEHLIKENPKSIMKEIIYTAFPIILGSAIYSIAGFVDLVMVANRMSVSGAFTQSQIEELFGQLAGKFVLLTTLPVSISTALSIAVLPSIAKSNVTEGTEAVVEKIGKALRISLFISIPSAVGLGVMAEPVLLMLFPSYPDGAILLQIGSVSVIFLSLVQVSTGMLQGIGKIAIPVIGAAAGVLVKIPLNFFLISIPEINVIGAVISTIACYFAAAFVNLYALKKYTGLKIDCKYLVLKPLLAAVIMGISAFFLFNFSLLITGINLIATLFSIAAAVLIYLGTLWLTGGLTTEDLQRVPILRRFIKNDL